MPLVTPPELQGLVAIAREEGLDMKPILLRVLTDLYVSAEMHSADEIAQFQEIGGTLAGQVDTETACVVACKLSAYAGTPPGVAEALVARGDDAARILLADAPWLPRAMVLAEAATGGRLLAAAVAARADLDGSLMRLLLARQEAVIDVTLAANTAVDLPQDVKLELLARSREEEAISDALLSRTDLAAGERAVLFLQADRTMRLRIIEDAERVALANRRGRPAPAAPPELGLALENAAIAGDQRAFAALLALALSTSPDKARRILEDRSGETLAVALVAIGLSDEVITRIFMFRDPLIGHSTQKLFALVDLSRRVSFGAAGLIMSAILGQEPRAATHRPVADTAHRAVERAVDRAAERAIEAAQRAEPLRIANG
jgi:uncharacterized protein (DUF2336 family)